MRPYTAVLLLAILFFVGCKEKDPEVIPPVRERSFLHIVSGVDSAAFDVTFDYFNADNKVIEDFFYQRSFPMEGYADLQAGGFEVDEFGNGQLWLTLSRQIFANEAPDTLGGPEAIVLNPEEKATLCFADSAGTVKLIKVADEYSFPDNITAAVRFINLSPNNAVASLSFDGGAFSIDNVAQYTASPFFPIGDDQLLIEAKDGNGNVLSSVNMWVSGGVAHTYYIGGGANDLAVFKH